MNLNTVMRFAFTPFMVFMLSFQCSHEDDDLAVSKCDCQTTPTMTEEKKDVEAVVVLITSYQGQDMYVLSTEPRDFSTTSHTAGRNILVSCDSLPKQYQKTGVQVMVSYKRKDCYGALTAPTLRSYYGYYVDLTSIRVKP
jgi:hypothetical protein